MSVWAPGASTRDRIVNGKMLDDQNSRRNRAIDGYSPFVMLVGPTKNSLPNPRKSAVQSSCIVSFKISRRDIWPQRQLLIDDPAETDAGGFMNTIDKFDG